MLKKFALPLAAILTLGTLTASCVTNSDTTPPEKSIDVYIIAGQSNGAGYTQYDPAVLSKLWSKYNVGDPNIIYSGRAEYTINVNTPEVTTGVNEFLEWIPVRAGMGCKPACMGAEVGMAAYFSENYYFTTDNTNKMAGIIKFAHGGTSLLNSHGGENAASGNWVSPSYAALLDVPYEGLTGGLYRGLLEQVNKSVNDLYALGYTDININGVFWMQGESDRDNPEEYGKAFKFFVDDIRRDIGAIMGEDLSELAIMIGEISETSGSATEGTVLVNNTFIEKQRELASEMDNVYVISSGQYKINWIENGKIVNGQDGWHWTTADMFAIGQLVGECIVENILPPAEISTETADK